MKRIFAVLSFVIALMLAVSSHAATAYQAQEHLSKNQLNALIAGAKTPADHQRIAAYYRAEADQYLAESQHHAKMASQFKANPTTSNAKFARQTVGHCEYLAESLKAQSAKASALAEQHEQMAKETAGN